MNGYDPEFPAPIFPERPTQEQLDWAAATGMPWYNMPRSPHFAPHLIGATAPHDPTLFAVDIRDTGGMELEATPNDFETPLRRISDENFMHQLELLLEAGLRVDVSGS